jgi:SAM-dependent methyltransferase
MNTDEHGWDGQRIEAILEGMFAGGELCASACAVVLGEQYHLGGAEDTRRMAQGVGITAADRVVDLACYVGGPARQLAREFGCQVVGVDISPVHIAVAERLTELVGQELASCPIPRPDATGQNARFCPTDSKVSFLCASADAVPLADGSFTVAWSQGSFAADLSWVAEIARLLAAGGRLAFTAVIRRRVERLRHTGPRGGIQPRAAVPHTHSLPVEEMAEKVAAFGFRVISAGGISQWEIEHGWLPARRKLEEREAHYRRLMGEQWMQGAYASLNADIAAWRSGAAGDGRIIAVKE